MTEKNNPTLGPPSSGDRKMVKTSDSLAHQFLMAMSRLFQLVRIHLPNNRLIIDSIQEFRLALREICLNADGANVRVYRGRIYLNQEKVNFSATMMAAATKLMEYLQSREIQGIRMYEKPELTNDDVILVITLLNQAGSVKDPVAWLQVELDKANQTWVELQAEQENKTAPEDSGLASISSVAAYGDEATAKAVPLTAPSSDGAGPSPLGSDAPYASDMETDLYGSSAGYGYSKQVTNLADLTRRTYAQVMASMARKTYSHALTSILSMSAKSGVRKKVGIQKSKRVIQGMIEIITKEESILLGMSTIRNYDDYTYTHSVNVAILAMCVGRRLGLSRNLVEQLGLCGLFHDLGKVDVPIELITKTSKLTDDEYEKVKSHSLNSVRQILRLNADHSLKSKLVLPPFEHHLGIDLSGYPQSTRKAPISLLGRILAVADHYDAMTSSRSYRTTPISPDIALKMMLEEAGTVLDPIILKVFIEMIGIYPVGSFLILNSREVGLAVETPKEAEDGRPVVLLLGKNENNQVIKKGYVNLSERDENGHFRRSVVRCCHPADYGIQPADYLV